MNCPVCQPSSLLEEERLEPHLVARECSRCGGHWIRLADYWRWRAQARVEHAVTPEELATAVPAIESGTDTPGLKRCPDCSFILGRYKVGQNVPFAIDRCRNCNGAWLDRDEWSTLRSHRLHDDLHLIFSDEWQRSARQEEQRRVAESRFLRHFGEEDFVKIRDLKSWLDGHSKRSELLAYIHSAVR